MVYADLKYKRKYQIGSVPHFAEWTGIRIVAEVD